MAARMGVRCNSCWLGEHGRCVGWFRLFGMDCVCECKTCSDWIRPTTGRTET